VIDSIKEFLEIEIYHPAVAGSDILLRSRYGLPCTVAGSTLGVLDGYGLRGKSAARPMLTPCIRFLSIDSHVCSTLPSDPTSRRRPLRFTSSSPPSG